MRIFATILIILSAINVCFAQEDNVQFSGALVAEPCTLPDADTDIRLDFGTIIASYLYEYQKTIDKPFSIHLIDCNPELLSSVAVTFQGNEDIELPGLLALDPGSSAKGVALGITDAGGSKVEINKATQFRPLATGSNTILFHAYVIIEPSALTTRALTLGNFSAITTFLLSYQ